MERERAREQRERERQRQTERKEESVQARKGGEDRDRGVRQTAGERGGNRDLHSEETSLLIWKRTKAAGRENRERGEKEREEGRPPTVTSKESSVSLLPVRQK